MTAKIKEFPGVSLSEQDFKAWYEGEKSPTPPEKAARGKAPEADEASKGAKLVQVKGCVACHSTDGSQKIGPTFKGVFEKKQTVLHEGRERELVADEAFIKEKLLHPEINRIKGFPPIMPSQQGQLTDADIDVITRYIKSLK